MAYDRHLFTPCVDIAIGAPVVSATAGVDIGRHARIAAVAACPHFDFTTTGCGTLDSLEIDCKAIVLENGDRWPIERLLVVKGDRAGVLASRGEWNSCWGHFDRRRHNDLSTERDKYEELMRLLLGCRKGTDRTCGRRYRI